MWCWGVCVLGCWAFGYLGMGIWGVGVLDYLGIGIFEVFGYECLGIWVFWYKVFGYFVSVFAALGCLGIDVWCLGIWV